MQLKQDESSGGVIAAPAELTRLSSSLPFGQIPSLSSLSGPAYVTAQVLVQQVAYKLSDKIFSFSPETFDLDFAAEQWAAQGAKNIHGEPAAIVPLETRTGAGTFALGYIFSPDFDLKKRHIPQSLLAPSAALTQLRHTLDQISLLYGVSSPFVAHVPALGYSAESASVISEYDSILRLSEDLGLGVVASTTAYETQHMAVLATLLAAVLPTLHVYDGVRMSRETLRLVDTISEAGIAHLYQSIATKIPTLNSHLDAAGKALEILSLLNGELGTDYRPFEYTGAVDADTVLVVFGSVEAQLARQAVNRLTATGAKVGVVNVRIYRPFAEEQFLAVLPESVRNIAVLGQVREGASRDSSVQSALYTDVLTAVSFSGKWAAEPTVTDFKYSPSEPVTLPSIADIFGASVLVVDGALDKPVTDAQQYSFWDLDTAASADVPTILGKFLCRESTTNIYLNETYDNLVQGGVLRSDLRASKQPIEAPYAIVDADVTFVGQEKLLKDINIVSSAKANSVIILRLPGLKAEEVEKRIPALVRQAIQAKGITLFSLDTAAFDDNYAAVSLVSELAFLKVARPEIAAEDISKLLTLGGHVGSVEDSIATLNASFQQIEVPATWAEVPEDVVAAATVLPTGIATTSFAPYLKNLPEPEQQLEHWEAIAKALVFKEAYQTREALRPELPVKTMTVTVKENRRLTPSTYDRNIFHIEFDLGTSGLTYNIGEALGIHAENDPEQVSAFIASYGLNPDAIVQVPSRESPAVLEARTVYQALIHNVDILGKPPKRFYEALSEHATDDAERARLQALGGKEGADALKKLVDEDAATYVDILNDFPSARPAFHELLAMVSPMKRREYSIASAQAVTPNSVTLMIVVVNWKDSRGRIRTGQATRYLKDLPVGAKVTVSVKPSVMKLPVRDDAPLIMAGLGTGLAPFRAFVQYRAMQKAQGKKIGSILLYMGSRHQREEYLYGEEWEAYLDSGVLTLMGAAFSRDQPEKIYIQDRMRQTLKQIQKAYIEEGGSFYLCGPTWPVPDVTAVLEEAIEADAKERGVKVNARNEIEKMKEEGRYVLEVY